MTFELDRFEWAPGTLELSGRWDRPRRFRHVRLVIDGRRIAPLMQTADGPWSARFRWDGEEPPADVCLEVGHDLLIELPAPDRVQARIAAVPDAEWAELASALSELAEGREELAAEREALEAERVALAAERESLATERAELERDREELAAQQTALAATPTPARAPAPAEAPNALKEAPSEVSAAPREAAARNGEAAHHAAWLRPRPVPRNPLELPRQPDEPVRGQAPVAIRAIAVALCSGVVLALVMLLSAIF